MDLNTLIPDANLRQAVRIGVDLVVVIIATAIALRIVHRIAVATVNQRLSRRPADGEAPHYTALEHRKRHATLEALAVSLARLVVLIVALVVVLAIFDVDIGPAIAGLGLLGLGVGLGLQGLVKDTVAGALIILEDQFARGDVVTIAGVRGTVEDFGLRRTVLRDEDGTVHVVSNGLIDVVSNETRVWARLLIDVPIRDPNIVEKAMTVILQAGTELAADPVWAKRLLDKPVIEGVESMSAAGVVVRTEVTVAAVERDSTAAEYRRRIVEAFAREKIALGDAGPLVLASPPGEES